ncbi:TPA: phosphonate metabolism protein PhnP, partial [Escherichia coli]
MCAKATSRATSASPRRCNMSLTLTLTGTGGAQGVPAWGCECAACARA